MRFALLSKLANTACHKGVFRKVLKITRASYCIRLINVAYQFKDTVRILVLLVSSLVSLVISLSLLQSAQAKEQ